MNDERSAWAPHLEEMSRGDFIRSNANSFGQSLRTAICWGINLSRMIKAAPETDDIVLLRQDSADLRPGGLPIYVLPICRLASDQVRPHAQNRQRKPHFSQQSAATILYILSLSSSTQILTTRA